MRNRETVLSEIKSAVHEERKCQLKVLELLREIEKDRHFLDMGYPSLYEFATRELGYSAGAAHRRIQSMRLLKTMPELEENIEDGSLSLCIAAKTQSVFKKEDKRRKEEGKTKLDLGYKQEVIQAMIGKSTRECERKIAETFPEFAVPPERERALADDKTLIQFTANKNLMEKLEKLKSFLAHLTFRALTARVFLNFQGLPTAA